MGRRLLWLAAAGILSLGAHAGAGQRPDLSGTWVASPETPAPTAPPVPQVFGPRFTIVHREPALTLTRTLSGSLATIRYVLDGSENASRMPGRLCQPDSGATWTARWDGQAVVISLIGATPPHGKPIKMDVSTKLSLESPDSLLVEVTARTAGQPAPRTTATVYTRSGPPTPSTVPSVQKATATMAQVAWIAGVWTGTMGGSSTGSQKTDSQTIEERWTPPAGGAMLAVSRTLGDGLMSAFEFLCIVERDGSLVYTAMPNGRTPATDFVLTKVDDVSATFENPAHDFPKIIRYIKRPDGSLEAIISGADGQKPQTYLFKRQ